MGSGRLAREFSDAGDILKAQKASGKPLILTLDNPGTSNGPGKNPATKAALDALKQDGVACVYLSGTGTDERKQDLTGIDTYTEPSLGAKLGVHIDSMLATREKEYIAKVMSFLKVYNDDGCLPNIINLSAFSRGCPGSIALSNEIYKVYGDKVKLNMIFIDPVPGPNSLATEDMRKIPPTVETLFACFATASGAEGMMDRFAKADSLDKLKFQGNTAVSAYAIPGTVHGTIPSHPAVVIGVRQALAAANNIPYDTFAADYATYKAAIKDSMINDVAEAMEKLAVINDAIKAIHQARQNKTPFTTDTKLIDLIYSYLPNKPEKKAELYSLIENAKPDEKGVINDVLILKSGAMLEILQANKESLDTELNSKKNFLTALEKFDHLKVPTSETGKGHRKNSVFTYVSGNISHLSAGMQAGINNMRTMMDPAYKDGLKNNPAQNNLSSYANDIQKLKLINKLKNYAEDKESQVAKSSGEDKQRRNAKVEAAQVLVAALLDPNANKEKLMQHLSSIKQSPTLSNLVSDYKQVIPPDIYAAIKAKAVSNPSSPSVSTNRSTSSVLMAAMQAPAKPAPQDSNLDRTIAPGSPLPRASQIDVVRGQSVVTQNRASVVDDKAVFPPLSNVFNAIAGTYVSPPIPVENMKKLTEAAPTDPKAALYLAQLSVISTFNSNGRMNPVLRNQAIDKLMKVLDSEFCDKQTKSTAVEWIACALKVSASQMPRYFCDDRNFTNLQKVSALADGDNMKEKNSLANMLDDGKRERTKNYIPDPKPVTAAAPPIPANDEVKGQLLTPSLGKR